jgi:hypothetical protein
MIYPERYRSEPSRRTPWISMVPGRIFVMGRSIPENPGEFYRPVYNWITEYSSSHIETTRLDLGFEYINTSSTKWIFNILKEISYYEQGDDDMCELGYILKSLIDCPFVFIEVEEMNKNGYEKILIEDAI